MSVEKRQMSRADGKLGIVKCSHSETVTIPSNKRIMVRGVISDHVFAGETTVMLHPTKKSSLPEKVEVIPHLVHYSDEPLQYIQVEIANPTSAPVTIQPRGVLCELQQVTVHDSPEVDTSDPNVSTSSAEGQDKENLTSQEDQPQSSTLPSQDKITDEEFLDQFTLPADILSPEERQEARKLLLEYRDIFSEGEYDIGSTQLVKHKIQLTDNAPFKQRHRRIPPSMYQEVRDHLHKLLDTGVIRESESPWASAIVLVRKRNGDLRFCIDYRQLNQRTVKDSYALPRVQETLDFLGGAKYFSCLDLRSGYYQVEVQEEDIEKTAFTVGPLGFFECNRMAFGLTNAPATFQRLMEKCMGELNLRECLIFLDDVITHSRTVEEQLQRLRRVFQRMRENGLKLNPGKCHFFQTSINYLGHVVSAEGVSTDPEKTARIKEWPTPRNVRDVREFLGFAGYYRRFVKSFSSIARPLSGRSSQQEEAKKEVSGSARVEMGC